MNRRGTKLLCSYCLHASVPAVKQCLPCAVYLCQNHLKVHSRSADHALVDVASVGTIKRCPQHDVDFSSYCHLCKACLCWNCRADHTFHNPSTLSDAGELKKTRLRQVLATLMTETQKVSEQIQQLESAKEELTQKICDVTCLVNVDDPLTVLQERESERRDFCDLRESASERRIRELEEKNREMTKNFVLAVLAALGLFGMLCFLGWHFLKLLFK